MTNDTPENDPDEHARALADGRRARRESGASECVGGEPHQWQPLSFRFESQLLDSDGRVLIRQPGIPEAQVYCVCMRCRGWTYVVTEWVGYYLGDPADITIGRWEAS